MGLVFLHMACCPFCEPFCPRWMERIQHDLLAIEMNHNEAEKRKNALTLALMISSANLQMASSVLSICNLKNEFGASFEFLSQ